jgi:hypothetical protein
VSAEPPEPAPGTRETWASLHRLNRRVTVIGETVILFFSLALGAAVFAAVLLAPGSWNRWVMLGAAAFFGLSAASGVYRYLIYRFREQ